MGFCDSGVAQMESMIADLGRKKRATDSLVAGPEMRYRPEAARRGRRSALPEFVRAVGAETKGS